MVERRAQLQPLAMLDVLRGRRKLVGQPLLYGISVFASLGVFLVFHFSLPPLRCFSSCFCLKSSSVMTKGAPASSFSIYYSHLGDISSVMSGVITGHYFQKYFNEPSALELGTIVAVLEVGAFGTWIYAYYTLPSNFILFHNQVTSIAAGRVGDIVGRRGTLFVGAVIFTIGGAIQTFAVGFWSMILGRIFSGFGVGLLSYVF